MHKPFEELVDFAAFEQFSRILIATSDVDPVYPLVSEIIKQERFEAEWFVYIYCLYYSLDSAIKVCRIFPTSDSWNEADFKSKAGHIRTFGAERRGTHRIFENQLKAINGWRAIKDQIIKVQSFGNAVAFRELIKSLPFQGDWAAFKITELHEKSLGYANLAPPNMDIGVRDVNSSLGPVGGCRLLYGIENTYPQSIAPEWEAMGVSLAARWSQQLGRTVDLGEVETCLCKYSKLAKGNYYPLHDINEFVHLGATLSELVLKRLLTRCKFPVQGWQSEHPKSYKKAFKDRREMLFADLDPIRPPVTL